MEIKKILVPVDFSEHSEYALEVAAQLARQNDAELLLLHMMGLSETEYSKGETLEMTEAMYYMKLAKKRFTTFLAKEYLKGIPVSEMVQNYKIFKELNNVAREQDMDLIVMGSHGAGGLSGFFVGSNTEKVVRSAEVPVLVIKERRPDFRIKEVVFACDFTLENKSAYLRAMRLFKGIGANVHLLYVNLPNTKFKSSTEIEGNIDNFLYMANDGKMGFKENVNYVCDYTVELGIYNYCKKINADLVAIPTHGRKGLSHFFMQSIGEDLANHASIPVMTFKM